MTIVLSIRESFALFSTDNRFEVSMLISLMLQNLPLLVSFLSSKIIEETNLYVIGWKIHLAKTTAFQAIGEKADRTGLIRVTGLKPTSQSKFLFCFVSESEQRAIVASLYLLYNGKNRSILDNNS